MFRTPGTERHISSQSIIIKIMRRSRRRRMFDLFGDSNVNPFLAKQTKYLGRYCTSDEGSSQTPERSNYQSILVIYLFDILGFQSHILVTGRLIYMF